MVRFTYTISDAQGLHARNAMQLARAAEGYHSRIRISCREKDVDGKQVLGLMELGGRCGDVLTFTLEGDDEAEAGAYLKALVKEVL